MSILIKGMKMPNDCPVCPLAHWNKLDRFTGCEIKKRYFDKADMETRGRPSFCPLVELPPHGRLIDADELKKQLDSPGAIICVRIAPTIIEAEVSE